MTAFAETLETEWTNENIPKATFHHTPFDEFQKGQITSHLPKTFNSGDFFQMIQTLFLDDGAFVFESREDLTKGVEIIKKVFEYFGLEMHVGRNGEKSKTECVFFPPPQFFKLPEALTYEQDADENDTAITTKPKNKTLSLKKMDNLYDNLDETKRIHLDDGYVDFTKHFKYLGNYISYHLRDDYDIDKRLDQAYKSMGALNSFWSNPYVDMYYKHTIFMAIPINLLLWGCESWALRESHYDKLDAFLHKSIRRILRITITEVREEKIRNERIRKIFYNIPDIRSIIAARISRFIGKVIRGPNDNPPKLFITAWCNHPRRPGKPLTTNKTTVVKALKTLLPETMESDDKGHLGNWINIAMDVKIWNYKIERLKRPGVEIPEPPSGPNHSSSSAPPPSPPPPRQPPSPPHRRQRNNHTGNSQTRNAFNILGLETSASERDIRIKFRQLSRIYHPDKHRSSQTGMSNPEATEHFQKLNNAQDILIDHLRSNSTP